MRRLDKSNSVNNKAYFCQVVNASNLERMSYSVQYSCVDFGTTHLHLYETA